MNKEINDIYIFRRNCLISVLCRLTYIEMSMKNW